MIVHGGLAALPGNDEPVRADIRIEDGRIAEIRRADQSPLTGAESLDASGMLVLPGAIDPHVHFDDPGFTEREDFAHGTAAAASGGVTTVIDMPFTSVPPITCRDHLEKKLSVIENQALVDFALFGGVSAQVWEQALAHDMEDLAEEILGFKIYMTSGMEGLGRLDSYQISRVLEKAGELGLPVLVHAEDHDYVSRATRVRMRSGVSPRDYYLSRPEIAEILAVAAATQLAKAACGNLHIVHVGTADAAELVRGAASQKNAHITAETAPHYLAFCLDDFEKAGSSMKVAPSVKSAVNRDRLWEHLRDGSLSFVASDHAPSRAEEKRTGSIWTDYSGIPGCSTLLPYLFSEGYKTGRLSLPRLLEVTSGAAAKRYGIDDRKGSLAVGMDADIVLVVPEAQTRVDGNALLSKGKITPFHGMSLMGKVMKTLVRGRVVYDVEAGIEAPPGWGKHLTRRSEE